MQKTCPQCLSSFEITPDDLLFYEKVSPIFNGVKYQIPAPTLCPDCRQQRRLSFRNENKLYHRKCDLSGKQIISVYTYDSPYKVYDQQEWWSDKWDAMDYGRDFDFNRSFFEQMNELIKSVPRIALSTTSSENSEYTHLAGYNKNCYLLFAGEYNENSLYCTRTIQCESCLDCLETYKSQYCSSCVNIENCYQVYFSQNCKNCSDSFFLYNCNGCRNCLFCTNLNQKEYCIKNVQYAKESYEQEKQKFLKALHQNFDSVQSIFDQFKLSGIHKGTVQMNCENSSGDYLFSTKNCISCFDCTDTEDCSYTYAGTMVKDCLDITNTTQQEIAYEGMSVGYNSYNSLFSYGSWTSKNVLYIFDIHSCQDCFACAGIKNKQYCIFNKQYTKEQYEAFVPKIIEHMKKMGEWGEFFPITLSPFAYNETVAQEYFPIDQVHALARGWKWREEEEKEGYLGPKTEIPKNIIEADESICTKILTCEITGKPYKIIPQEFTFYKKMNLPIPRRSPDQRHKDRLLLRNPRKLWNRNCGSCGKGIQTTYAPERPEIVYCEECYLKSVY